MYNQKKELTLYQFYMFITIISYKNGVPEWTRTTAKPDLGGLRSFQLSYEDIYIILTQNC